MSRTVELIRNGINKRFNKILPTHQKTDNERATLDPVVELKAGSADDSGKVNRTVEMVIYEELDEIMLSDQETENKRVTQDSVFEFKPKPISVSLGPHTQIEGKPKMFFLYS